MRLLSLRLFVPLFLAVSSVAVPASASAAPVSVSAREGVSAAGLYRLTMTAKNRKAKSVHMVVRDGLTGLSGVLLDNETTLELTNLRMEGAVLKANIMTNEGLGALELTLDDDAVTGTLTVDGKLLVIQGDHDN